MKDHDKTQELADFLLTTLKEAKTFTLDQAPDVYKEIIAYGIWDAKFGIFVGFTCLILAVLFAAWAMLCSRHRDSGFVAAFLGIVCFFIGSIILPCSYLQLKKIELAPKTYIIQELTKEK